MNKDELEEYVEKRVHANSQTLEVVVASIQKDLQGIRDDLPGIVKETVNGKIDKLSQDIKDVLDLYKESRSFFNTIKKVSMYIIPVGGAWAIISKIWK